MSIDLFVPVVSDNKLHPLFQSVRSWPGYAAARNVMNEVFGTLVDVDGNFIEQFQSVAFDARTWELYLHAYFTLGGFSITDRRDRPDYILHRAGQDFCVEAVTSNPRDGSLPIDPTDPTRARALFSDVSGIRDEHIFKLAKALHSKLKKRYWELPHVAGKPLIFAVESFHGPESLNFSDAALSDYLYGVRAEAKYDSHGRLHVQSIPITEHRVGTKTIPSGFFAQPGTEHVSAVLFTNAGTVSKFARMGHQGAFSDHNVMMVHLGNRYDHDPNASKPAPFIYEVGKRTPPETWGEGVTVIHNPRAKYPLMPEVFDEVCQQWFEDGQVTAQMPAFHPYRSVTKILVVADSKTPTLLHE